MSCRPTFDVLTGCLLAVMVMTGCAAGTPAIISVQEPMLGFRSIADRGHRLHRIPEINDRFRGVRRGRNLQVSASGWLPFETVTVEGIRFEVGVNRHDCVDYIATFDATFSTPEGISPGSTLDDVLATGAKAPWNEWGWAAHTELASGWSVAFESGTDDRGRIRNKETSIYGNDPRVAWVFKRGGAKDTCVLP